MEDLDESAFVARLQAGDDHAFEELLRANAGRMLQVARRFLVDEDDARDAVQDAFLSAYRSIDRFESTSKLSTWLHRIVVNAALMKLRTRRRHPEEELDAMTPEFKEDGHPVLPASEWPLTADELMLRKETRDLVRASIEQLPDNYRIVLLMRDIEEMDTGETAEALGITPNAVKIRLHRARQALRSLLETRVKELTQ